MIKYFCDRCEGEIKQGTIIKHRHGSFLLPTDNPYQNQEVVLCEKCYAALQKWLKGDKYEE